MSRMGMRRLEVTGGDVVSRLFIGTCVALSFLEVGCSTIAEKEQKYGAPANYRQLVAQELLQAQGSSSFSSASISQPTVSFAGIADHGERQIVCARTVIDGPLIPSTTRWMFLFEGGKISATRMNPPGIYCNFEMTPFPEALKRRG